MKVLLDACVLYPTVMREILIGAAKAGLFCPLWSARILEEWARATRKIGPKAELFARGEITLLEAEFPRAKIAPSPGLEAQLWLPDENDIHVLAAAVAGSADIIVTMNAKDFPQNILAEQDLTRRDPDGFLWQMHSENPEKMLTIANQVQARAVALSGQPQDMRKLMKKARLPRFGKAVALGGT